MWQFNANPSSWSPTISANWPPVAAFVAGINFAGLTNLTQAKLTVTGATAYGISSDQLTFGWITGTFSGKSLSATGLANGISTVEWWNTTTGIKISSSAATVAAGALTATIPASTSADIAFKIISPNSVGALLQRLLPSVKRQEILSYDNGMLRLLEPLSGESGITITSIQGRVIAHYKVPGSSITGIPIERLSPGIYSAKISSNAGFFHQKLLVTEVK
jgi:hypothetical protein